MKAKSTFFSLLVIAGSSLATILGSNAATVTWDANAGTAAQTDGAGAWLTASQWWNSSTNATWTSGDDAVFGNGGAGGAVTLASATTAGSLTFNRFTGTYTLGTVSRILTINNGITMNAGASAVTFISPVKLGANQTWINNTGSTLSVNDGTNSVIDTNTFNLTFKGNGPSRGNFNIVRGNGITGSGNVTVDNAYLDLRGGGVQSVNNYTGTTTVQNGGAILYFSNNIGTGNIELKGGTIEGYFNEGFTRQLGTGSNQFQITGGVSGFGVNGSSTINFSNVTEVQWGSATFNPSKFVLGGGVNGGTNTFAEGIDLNGADRTITTNVGGVLSAVVRTTTGTAGLIKEGAGTLSLTAANTYNGATTIAAGTLTLSGSGTLANTTALNLSGGGTLQLTNTAQVNRFADGAAVTVSAGGGITYANTAGANLNYTETLGSIALNGGLLNVNLATNQNNATNNSQTLTLGGLTPSGTGSVAFSAATTGPQASGGDNMIVVSGAGSTTAGEIIGSWATTGTTAALQTDYAIYNANYVTPANIAASAQSGWTTATAATSNYTMSALASATISGGTKNINSLRSTNNSVTVTASNANIALASHTLAVGDVVTFSAATMPTGLTAGTAYYVVSAVAGTSIQVSATPGGTAITPTTAGTTVVAAGGIKVSSGNNLGTTGILNGSATTLNIVQVGGAGIITLPTTSAGNLYINTGSGGITSSAPISNNTGALTLVKNGSGALILTGANNAYTGDTIINAGTLQVGISGSNVQLNGGSYAGNIFIGAGAALTLQGNASNTLSGIISGDGNLNLNRGTTTLSGNNTYTGKTSMILVATNALGSTLNVSSFNSVVGGTASSSLGAPTTVANGTIDFGGGGIQQSAQINYTGSGETTDRILNFQFNGNTVNRVIDSSGSANSLLKFTSAPISNGVATNNIVLQGSTDGEFTQGLPFGFTNLTKSGNGTWTLGGVVGNTGTTTVSGGTLVLQNKSSILGGNTANWTAAKIVVNSGATLAVNVGGAGELNNGDVTTLLTNLGGLGGAINNNGLRSGSSIGFDTTNATGGSFTIANNISNATGTGSGAIGLIKRGTGKLILSGTNTYSGVTTVSAGTLEVNGSVASASTVVNGVLAGSGVLTNATLSGSGSIDPGSSPGILTASDVDPSGGLDFNFEFTQEGVAPDWDVATASINDVMRLTDGSTPFNTSLTAANVISIYLNVASVSGGDTFTGGFFTNRNSDFLSSISSATFLYLLADPLGTEYNGVTYSAYSGSLTFTVDTIPQTADFTSGTVSGYSLQITAAIPETSTTLLGAIGALALLRRRRK